MSLDVSGTEKQPRARPPLALSASARGAIGPHASMVVPRLTVSPWGVTAWNTLVPMMKSGASPVVSGIT